MMMNINTTVDCKESNDESEAEMNNIDPVKNDKTFYCF